MDWVETRIRLMGLNAPGDGDILQICNDINDRVARDLHIPRRYIKNVNPTQPFSPPSEARPGGITFAERTDTDRRIMILTVTEANDYYPDWERNQTEGFSKYATPLIIYDPVNISAPIYPIGFSSGDTLRMVYVMNVKPMVFENPDATQTTEPFNGEMPEYHRIVPQLAVFEIAALLARSDNTMPAQKAQMYYNDAKGELEDAFDYARHDYFVPYAPDLGDIF